MLSLLKVVTSPVTWVLLLGTTLFTAGYEHAKKVDRAYDNTAQVAQLQRELAADQAIATRAQNQEQATLAADAKLKATIRGYVNAYASDLSACGLSDTDLNRLRALGAPVVRKPAIPAKHVRPTSASPNSNAK